MDTAQPTETPQSGNNAPQPTTGPVVSTPEAVSPATKPTQPPPSKNSRKKLILSLLGVLLLLAIGAGVYAFSQNNKQPTTDNTQLTTISPTAQPTIDPTAGWQEYSNSTYNYSIKVPESWKIEREGEEINNGGQLMFMRSGDYWSTNNADEVANITQGVELNIQTNYSSRVTADFQSFLNFRNEQNVIYEKEILIDREKAVLRKVNNPLKIPGWTQIGYDVAVLHNGEGYAINVVSAHSQDELVNQILSTFKFTDSDQAGTQNTVNTSNWKTYSNQLQEYSIKYPSTYVVDPHSKENECYILYSSQAILDRQSQYPTIDELEITICSMEYTTNPSKTYSSLRDYVYKEDHESGLAVENVTWVNINAIEVAKEKMGDTDRYYWLHDGYIYYIDVQPNNSKLQKEAGSILSTFKFTN